MKLKLKILAGYGVALGLVILVCGWGIINLRRLGKASDGILQENYRSILAAENMIDAIERQDSATLLIILGREDQGIQQFHTYEVIFLQWLGRAKDNITIPGETEILADLEGSYENYLITFTRFQQQQQLTETEEIEYYNEALLPFFEEVRETSIELRELNQETMVASSEATQVISQQAIWSMVIAGSTAAGLGLVFSLLLSNRLVEPLREMTRATEEIAEGKYNIVITANSEDEVGHLGKSINVMSQRLKAFHDLNIGKVIIEKQRSEAIINSIGDGLVVVDDQYDIIAINPIATSILQTTVQKAIGKHFLDIFNRPDLYGKIKEIAQSPPSLPLTDEQSILTVKRGEKTEYYSFAITPVATEENVVLGVVLLLQNVTKLKELDQMKSDFVATASHELRTPLTGMSMSINLLLENTQDKLSESEKELLEIASEDVERLRNLVNDLLDLSKMESGRIEMEFAEIEINFLLEKAASLLAIQAQEKEIKLTQTAPADLPPVEVDPNKIIWVLTNLIANAIRYTDVGGEVQISATPRGNWVEVSVADNGAGIPWEYQSRIFDKFVQVQTEKDVGGTGLGLAICKEVVNAHGGRIWVNSTPGEGSEFTFTVPLVRDSS